MTISVKVFFTKWCGQCGPYKKNLTEAGIPFVNVDADEQIEECQRYGVRSLPTTVIEKDGEVVVQFSGNKPVVEVKKILEEVGGD